MKTSEAIWMFLPEGLEELFDLVRIDKTDKAYDLWLDEKKERSEEDRLCGLTYSSSRLAIFDCGR